MEEKILQAIEALQTDMNDRFSSLTERVDYQGKQINALTEKVDYQGTQIKENTQILKALEHLAQVNKAEHDKMAFSLTELSGEIKGIKKGLANVEMITASNWSDITILKAAR